MMVTVKSSASKAGLLLKGFRKGMVLIMRKFFLQLYVHLSSIRTLLAFAAEKKLQVHQMDVVSAFLNGELRNSYETTTRICAIRKGRASL